MFLSYNISSQVSRSSKVESAVRLKVICGVHVFHRSLLEGFHSRVLSCFVQFGELGNFESLKHAFVPPSLQVTYLCQEGDSVAAAMEGARQAHLEQLRKQVAELSQSFACLLGFA